MKKAALLVLLGFASILMADCIVVSPRVGPPPFRDEVILASPGSGYVWISGYWGWSAGRYVWVSGRWAKARPGRTWVPGQWAKKGPKWHWRRGYWK